jgi:hypothetical protein
MCASHSGCRWRAYSERISGPTQLSVCTPLVTAITGWSGAPGHRWRHMSEETRACSLLTPLVEEDSLMASTVRLKLPLSAPSVSAASASTPTSSVQGRR